MIHLLSLGAGVQSSTLALMAAHGEVKPLPMAAIFADTQAEPTAVYRWIKWLERELPYPVFRVSAGNLEKNILTMRRSAKGRLYSQTNIPVFTKNEDGHGGRIRWRGCTRDFKIRPLQKQARKLAGIKRGRKDVAVVFWLGISVDELLRAKPSREKWYENRFPLIELRMTRQDCLDWMQDHAYPRPPRSACYFCPFHSDNEWRHLRENEPATWQRAIRFERRLQRQRTNSSFTSVCYLHRALKPLAEVDLRTDVERGQRVLWQDECEGLCGV